jgi:phosphate transport system substrate-binding protein
MKSKYKWVIILIVAIIVAYLLIVPGLNVQRMDIVGSTSVQPLAEELADAYAANNTNIKISVQGGGSGMGIRSTHQGITDIGMSSKELDASNNQNITQIELGKEGIVVAVANENNISDLSTDQIKGIFNGNITNWKEVGGKDQEIHVITREEGSGTRDAFQSLIMGKTKILSTAVVQSSTESVKQAVSTDPGAIGYISFAHMGSDVKGISVNGVYPSEETISNGDYKLQRPFLFLVKGKPTGEVKKFLEWVKSPEGTKIIKEDKIIPVS